MRRLERLRMTEACLIAPALQPRWRKAFLIRGGAICAVRSLPPGPGTMMQIEAGLALSRAAQHLPGPLNPEQAEDMLLIDGFIRRPAPELTVLPLDGPAIRAHLERRPATRAA